MFHQERARKPDRTLRWMLIVLGIVLLLGGGYAAYRMSLGWRISKRLEAIRAQGHPTSIEELNTWYAAPPPGQNAAIIFEKAFPKFVFDIELSRSVPCYDNVKLPLPGESFSEEMKSAMRTFLEANAEALRLLREAAAMEHCRFFLGFRGGTRVVIVDHLGGLRDGVRHLKVEAILRAAEGRSDEAADSISTSLDLARAVSKEPLPISRGVRIDCIRISTSGLEIVLNHTPVSDERLARLSEALKEAECPEGLTRALAGGRVLGIDAFSYPNPTHAANDGAWPDAAVSALRVAGLLRVELVRYLDIMSEVLQATSRAEDEREDAIRELGLDRKMEQLPAHCVTARALIKRVCRHLEDDSRCIAYLRTARAAVAVERYRLDKARLPRTLDDLVPDYLDAVPLDPFDGKALRYKKVEKGYIIYSVGPDGKDDGAPPSAGGNEGRVIRYREKDITFIMDR